MKSIALLGVAMFMCIAAKAQYKIILSIKQTTSKQPLAGATVIISSINKTAIADSAGSVAIDGLTPGRYSLVISYTGFEEKTVEINVPQTAAGILEILLEEPEEMEEVVVTSTRTSRLISDIPTRIETISGEELSEKANMKPGDIRMLLNESTGIQTQQTSATSYNSSIRIQGLDGRYTQILRDGFPMYAGFSGGLSLMQVAPLDLRQIEVIKGSSSTLYGGGAIAGLVNLISKTPTGKRELSFLANGTSAGGLDLSGFYSQRFKTTGVTIFSSRNTNQPFDPGGIGLTAIPAFTRYTIAPRFFLYGKKTNADIGFSYITEDRIGGSMDYINKGITGYFEKNNTDRFVVQSQLTHQFNAKTELVIRNSYSRFNRLIQVPSYTFTGTQHATFSEATFHLQQEHAQWVIGANFVTDDFVEGKQSAAVVRDYQYNTTGVFIQHAWTATNKFTIETGLRGDYTNRYGFVLLPRLSAMLKLNHELTFRMGGGLGYKTPTVFTEDAEKIQFRQVLPINEAMSKNERSAGMNFDINYRTRIGELGFSVNQLFFYTRLNHPLVLTTNFAGEVQFQNANGHIDTRGTETNLRFMYNGFKLFIGYTYADVNTHYNNIKNWLPLTARHRLNNVLMYEVEGKLKIGAEAYFFSPQKLSDGSVGRSYWTFGLMAEKTWKGIALFINFENLTDTRQTKFDTIYNGLITDPVFKDIYAPVDGFVVNGGMKIRL